MLEYDACHDLLSAVSSVAGMEYTWVGCSAFFTVDLLYFLAVSATQ